MPPVTDFLSSQRASSRSFRRRSRDALLAARASSSCGSSASSARDGGGVEGRDARIGSWLCVPVLGISSSELDVAVHSDGGGGEGAVTVCCAVNKKNGRSFDDVDEVRVPGQQSVFSLLVFRIFGCLARPCSSPHGGERPVIQKRCLESRVCIVMLWATSTQTYCGTRQPDDGDVALRRKSCSDAHAAWVTNSLYLGEQELPRVSFLDKKC